MPAGELLHTVLPQTVEIQGVAVLCLVIFERDVIRTDKLQDFAGIVCAQIISHVPEGIKVFLRVIQQHPVIAEQVVKAEPVIAVRQRVAVGGGKQCEFRFRKRNETHHGAHRKRHQYGQKNRQ